jgi:hypothetical protein
MKARVFKASFPGWILGAGPIKKTKPSLTVLI